MHIHSMMEENEGKNDENGARLVQIREIVTLLSQGVSVVQYEKDSILRNKSGLSGSWSSTSAYVPTRVSSRVMWMETDIYRLCCDEGRVSIG